jgi:hypothetical protein
MVSARKIESNRANAKASTGPKSAEGKARAAQNARRHGLNVPIGADRLLAEQVIFLAQEIALGMSGSELIELAARIAEAEVDLRRIRQRRRACLDNSANDRDRGSQKLRARGSDLTKELVLIDRYERRAMSRRKFAIRAFDLARRQAARTRDAPPPTGDVETNPLR